MQHEAGKYPLFLRGHSIEVKRGTLNILTHVIVWALFLSLPAFFRPVRPGEHEIGILHDILIAPRLGNAVVLIIVFYFNYSWAIPQYYVRKRYGRFLFSVLLSFGLLLLVNALMRPANIHPGPGFSSFFVWLGPSHNIFMFICVFGFSFALSLYRQWRIVKEEQLQTEISFLKAQINPHFLFNTLNSIYSLALTKSDRTPEAIVKLSSIMRYSVTEATRDFVALSKEVDYIGNYITLQQMRLTNRVKLDFSVSGKSAGKKIAPFILIPFIENAFKHGVNPEENSYIKIDINIAENQISLRVINSKVYVQHDDETAIGLGIKNTKQRLELLYAGKYKLEINDKEDDFDVLLQITLV